LAWPQDRFGSVVDVLSRPLLPSTVSCCPVVIRLVAFGTPTTAGMPYSRAHARQPSRRASWPLTSMMAPVLRGPAISTNAGGGAVTRSTRVSFATQPAAPLVRSSRMLEVLERGGHAPSSRSTLATSLATQALPTDAKGRHQVKWVPHLSSRVGSGRVQSEARGLGCLLGRRLVGQQANGSHRPDGGDDRAAACGAGPRGRPFLPAGVAADDPRE
jgi:hypothetical protein